MTDPPDEIGTWLDKPVEPLPPPPGTYERIRRGARRRKRNQAIAAAATAAAVIAGVVAAPRLATVLLPSGHSPPVAASAEAGRLTPSHGLKNKLPTGPTVLGTGQPVPSGFEPISATFVGLKTGWTLGTLRTPCTTAGCVALARTDNTGATWYRVGAPTTVTATAGTGVSQVRFLNLDDGWIFGPELWWTTDGGQDWHRVDTGGMRVVSLEAVRDRAFAVFARCPDSQPRIPNGGAGGCQSYQLYSSVAGTATWQRVPGAAAGSGTAAVVPGRNVGYLLGTGGSQAALSSGPVSGNGAWTAVTQPCLAAPASAAGAAGPAAGSPLLATAAPDALYAVCPARSGPAAEPAAEPAKTIVSSSDGGRSWRSVAAAPIPGTAYSVAAAPGGSILVIATSAGLYVSGDGGTSWQLALTGPPGGFSYVGMTDVLQGFAIPASPGQNGILFTTDGGTSWRWSMVPRPG